jgi:putative salt-induced outer membrane protein YdiY
MTQKLICGFMAIIVLSTYARSDIIILSSGEKLDASVISQTDSTVSVRHPILGDFDIDTKDVASIDGVALHATKPVDSTSEKAPIEDIQSAWSQFVTLGLGIQNGQKDSSNFSTVYNANKTVDKHTVIIDMSYRRSESDGERTENRFSSSWDNSWLQPNSDLGFFTTLQFDWAEFQNWDQRLVGDLGISYNLIAYQKENEKFSLSLRLGSGLRKEFQSENQGIIPEGLLGISVLWALSEKQTLSADSTWYPDYEDTSNYRVVTNASWNLQLESSENLQFSLGFLHEYDSVVSEDVEKTNLQLTAGITYSF